MILFILLATLGFTISLYTYITEQKVRAIPNYKPFCDLSDHISCSKPMVSPYANVFFFSNTLFALLFYGLIAILALWSATILLLIATASAAIVSCVLAYILFFKIRTFCMLCVSLYLINFMLLYLSIQAL